MGSKANVVLLFGIAVFYAGLFLAVLIWLGSRILKPFGSGSWLL